MDTQRWRSTIAAAQAGDRRALDELVAGWLPLVYNIVGRALNGHADVDDVVQETMLRAVENLGSLRDPDSFRSWLVAIAIRQIRDRARRRPTDALRDETADEAADFAELTVLRLQLEGQRREVAEAVRWLDDEDRQLLSLWWLEVAGELSRRELAAAVGISRQHTAVRVQRMKERLEASRGIVRALDGACPDLREATARWDGVPDSVWRKRLARHIRGCAYCANPGEAVVVPAERLLVGIALVPVPVGFTLSLAFGGKTAVAATTGASVGWSGKVLGALTKPAVALSAGATIIAGGVYVVTYPAKNPPPAVAAPTARPRPQALTTSAPPSPSASPSASPSPTPTPSPTPSPSASRPEPDLYGTVVDAVDTAPDPNARPAALPHRPEAGITSTGGAHATMNHRGDGVTLTGQGYVLVRWQIVTQYYRTGGLVMPAWTGLKGKLFHVASGGGRRMDDRVSGTDSSATGMGSSTTGYSVPPAGTQQMWQNEYFYVDGSVTLTVNERGADYNLNVFPTTWDNVEGDVTTGPPDGAIRYGLVRDTGTDDTPVPQYATRDTPADPATVAQKSRL
ncbi:RNA polymerase sigma factor [Streptomyces sp. WI04-05B]|uniref:RNA polymerase sigma factor n=1 Tax=Streptomyces TaxID=1883 RepID=UPI0029B3773E|nr:MULTISPECIES: sigma-70 family RNA polymerase sigma factor [unclassified Streptomyces]MDX2541983.1 sigma-70 family RNA polymerase sigma factor [Streptomyces sp. WI04-05B]MDX2587065.1 sigma-70 family RNA polymerase sigma factor [Streptomyces sp. WI04-05A]